MLVKTDRPDPRLLSQTSYLLALVLICFFAATQTASSESSGSGSYLESLLLKAKQKDLAAHPYWKLLLHYKPRILLPGERSLIDDSTFFLSPDGKRDAEAELEATIKSFFDLSTKDRTELISQCRFVARYRWLKNQLNFDSKQLPEAECPHFEEWRENMAASGMTLVFPSAYFNNPASMYGHTLLRIDAADQNEQTRLLAYTTSFTASTGEDGGLAFAAKGLLGGYLGSFSVIPYYIEVTQYSDMENRDIWEYQLALNQEEVDRAVFHLWELTTTYFDYYFFDENCSYHLLSLLEAAKPELKLTDEFKWWALPSDTVKVITENYPELINKIVFRPAASSKMQARAENLSSSEIEQAKGIALGADENWQEDLQRLEAPDKAAVLDMAIDYRSYLNEKERGKDTAG
ncbi:hypothetical protein BVY02_02050, partial [bacterium J17]